MFLLEPLPKRIAWLQQLPEALSQDVMAWAPPELLAGSRRSWDKEQGS